MANPPLTTRRIPLTVEGWRNEVKGIRRFLKRSQKLGRDNGPEWVQKTVKYYEQRLEDLLDNAPPVLVRKGEARKARESNATCLVKSSASAG